MTTVVGGTVAALVAADALARRGGPVELLLPRRGVGGGFAPLTVDGRRLERGIRVLELHYEGAGEPPPLELYDAAGAGHRPFVARVDAYVRALVGDAAVVPLGPARMWLGGRLVDEVLLGTDLARLELTPEQAAQVLRQVPQDGPGLLGPGGGDALWTTSLSDASRAHHGALLHDLLVDALARKVRAAGGDDVPAALRRKLWLPLFHPTTVRQLAQGGGSAVTFRPRRPFHTVEPGGPGEIVTRLVARLEAARQVTVRRIDGVAQLAAGPGDTVLLTPVGEPTVSLERPVLALAPGELFAAAGVAYRPERVTSVLAWVDVAAADAAAVPPFVHVLDPDVRAFRITRGAAVDGRVTICVELAHEVSQEAAPAVAADVLRRLGLIAASAPLTSLAAFAGPTFTAPTFDSRARFDAARAAYDALGIPAR
ncbi:MAG: hypothetical protein JWM31_661, partial [Solirubrobacterales bacterium]|nr:hypothetical protein [Solirubrobacterales bacterium]